MRSLKSECIDFVKDYAYQITVGTGLFEIVRDGVGTTNGSCQTLVVLESISTAVIEVTRHDQEDDSTATDPQSHVWFSPMSKGIQITTKPSSVVITE